MANAVDDLVGTRFNGWTVIARGPNVGRHTRWVSRCDACGTERTFYRTSIKRDEIQVCACSRTPADSTHPEFTIWRGMRERCSKATVASYPDYGGRGIRVCERWENDFQAFLADMGPRPSLNHSIDRKNNDGNYEPGNCRWATRAEQNRNARSNRMLEMNGVVKCVAEWADEYGVPRRSIANRIDYLGWSVVDAITTPARKDGARAPDGRYSRNTQNAI